MLNIFQRFFNKYFNIGVFLILISIIINECILQIPQWLLVFVEIFEKLLNTIGISLLIGSVFDFSKNSDGFMNYVSNLLKEIIVSKNFLNGLDVAEKRNALEMILKPSGDQLVQCSDIGLYFKSKINESLEMFYTNFKTNLVVNVVVKKKDGLVVSDSVLTYRVYKIEDKYFPLVTTFERDGGFVEESTIIYPGGEKTITENDITNNNNQISATNAKTFSYDIPEELYQYPYLTIKKKIHENGYDHWTNLNWSTLTPTDGVIFNVLCMDNLFIKEFFLFDDNKTFHVNENKEKTQIEITTSQWLDTNSGFTFTISDSYIKNCQ